MEKQKLRYTKSDQKYQQTISENPAGSFRGTRHAVPCRDRISSG